MARFRWVRWPKVGPAPFAAAGFQDSPSPCRSVGVKDCTPACFSSWESPRSGRCPGVRQAGSGADFGQRCAAICGLGAGAGWFAGASSRAGAGPLRKPRLHHGSGHFAGVRRRGRARRLWQGSQSAASLPERMAWRQRVAQQGWQNKLQVRARNGVNSKTKASPPGWVAARGFPLERLRLRLFAERSDQNKRAVRKRAIGHSSVAYFSPLGLLSLWAWKRQHGQTRVRWAILAVAWRV